MKGRVFLEALRESAEEPQGKQMVLVAAVITPANQVGHQPLEATGVEVENDVQDPYA